MTVDLNGVVEKSGVKVKLAAVIREHDSQNVFGLGILGQVWCLIVLIPDLCPLSYFEQSGEEGKYQESIHTYYHNSNLIWRTVSRRVDEVIPSDHPRRVASRVIQWYGIIHET